ncbi:MAG: hypothetical protein PVH18_00055, partial [Chloroflexota bacterium]
MTADKLVQPELAAFTIDGQEGHQRVSAGATVTLQAIQSGATSYHWSVRQAPSEAAYELVGEAEPEASLTLETWGAYTVRLEVKNGSSQNIGQAIVWVTTPNNGYALPATSEPLRFNGLADWPGDLDQVILDVDSRLPSTELIESLSEAESPGAGNPFITQSALPEVPEIPPPQLDDDEVGAIKAAEEANAENRFAT